MNLLKVCFTSLVLALMLGQASAKELDRIAIVVDSGVVLESEVQALMSQVKTNLEQEGRALPSDEALRVQVTERLITEALQLQLAERMGFVISDAQLDHAIRGIAGENNVTLEQLRNQIERSGDSWRSYRESIRKQIITSEVQRVSVQRRIYMSPQEVSMLVELIKEQGGDQTEYNMGHILARIQTPDGSLDVEASQAQAEQIIAELNRGGNFRDLSISASSASNALEGGDMGWLTLSGMPTLFASAVESNPTKGAIIGPLRSGIGFHILTVHDVRGQTQAQIEEVRSRHILMRPSVILSEAKVQEQLETMRQQILDGTATFAELAEEHSADPGSARNGGDLGFAESSLYVPAFKHMVDTLEIGTISEPFRTEHGWHIVEVLERRTQDVTEKRLEERARQILFSRKYQEELDIWLQELRDSAYIEFKE
ncbi:peptidylprolyl isomerase SurA [Aliidiomarina taiwanensis]|uniref:Chaperone SurA n=1 Tax=Aliidiomarina taiwanensis TaxID=946228 RepID=A0A432X1F0_9GAMM|nr:peptidylprolyl isomerase SurA [Aliidiomarina taiwanensis]RUO40065.1 peptidylprolyl isomerase SurA [Aliidiomarina taiwanensis]